MSDKAYEWGDEHFCEPDTRHLYDYEPKRLVEVGYPVKLDAVPEPETFCSRCLQWFTTDHPEGGGAPPPQESETE